VIAARKLSSAMSAANAACDHMRDWFNGTADGVFTSMGVFSDGSYNVPEGIMYSYPVTISAESGPSNRVFQLMSSPNPRWRLQQTSW